MTYRNSYRGLSVCIAVALSVACEGPEVPPSATLSAATQHAGHSWMAPGSSSQNLLYITGGCGGICVFKYPGKELVGELADSNTPMGECVDKAGDVFAVNFEGTIYEYAHGGTSPIATLNDPGYYAQSCSIDSTTGNLAVANLSEKDGDTGTVAIYAGATGDSTLYADPHIDYINFCTYDDKGDLFVDGESAKTGAFELDELPSGSVNFKTIKFSQGDAYPYDIQWDGKYLALAHSTTVIYHVAISGTKGAIVGSTVLNGPVSIVEVQFWIRGGTIVAPFETSESGPELVGYWNYPAGGKLRRQIEGSEFSLELFGTAVSPATSR